MEKSPGSYFATGVLILPDGCVDDLNDTGFKKSIFFWAEPIRVSIGFYHLNKVAFSLGLKFSKIIILRASTIPVPWLLFKSTSIEKPMRNSILLTSDLSAMVLVDTKNNDQRLSIGKRGVLLSVLGTDVCATEVPAALDEHIKNVLKGEKHFYEFEVADIEKNQLCITYNEGSNVVFIIGITDIIASLSGPTEINPEKVKTYAVKLKEKSSEGLASKSVILARLESPRSIGGKKYIRFYFIDAN